MGYMGSAQENLKVLNNPIETSKPQHKKNPSYVAKTNGNS
jgi:hypothetical protein